MMFVEGESPEIDDSQKGMFEIAAMGLGGVALFLLVEGCDDYQRGQFFLKLPGLLKDKEAFTYTMQIVERGVSEIQLGLTALTGATGAIVKRIRS